MKKSVMFLLLSLVCLSVSAQNGKVKSGVIGGVSMDWYKDEAMSKGKVGFNIPDMKPSFHVGYQLQFELKHRLSVDAALLYAVSYTHLTLPTSDLIIWAEAGRNCLGWQ